MVRETIRIAQSIEPELKYFKYRLLSKSSEEEFKETIYHRYKIEDNELDMETKERINDIIKEGYKDCLNMLRLLMDKGVYYSYSSYSCIRKGRRYLHWSHYEKKRESFNDKCFELVKCRIFYHIDEKNRSVREC